MNEESLGLFRSREPGRSHSCPRLITRVIHVQAELGLPGEAVLASPHPHLTSQAPVPCPQKSPLFLGSIPSRISDSAL